MIAYHFQDDRLSMILFHLIFALLSVGLGIKILFLPKGTRQHKKLGRIWNGCMALVSLSSFGIQEINPSHYSWIHLLSVWTLFSLCMGIYSARQHWVKTHQIFMIGSFLGLIGAGLAALMPGRFIYRSLYFYLA